jgi:protein-S-isoprenylcysteine O-methyltransferase Ste14
MILAADTQEIRYGLLESTDINEMAALLADVFSRFDPPAVAVGLSYDEEHGLVKLFSQGAPDAGLTIVARANPSGRLINFRFHFTPEVIMFVLVRAVTYAALFIGLVLVYLPARLLTWSGIVRPGSIELPQIAGIIAGSAGAAIALWCIFSFAFIGRGTPAPFDPPRRLVIRGPYRFVRNPMYVGAGVALAGAALFFLSLQLLGFAAAFFLATHLFVVLYEEPTLRRTFGQDYEAYCGRVRRWWPHTGMS